MSRRAWYVLLLAGMVALYAFMCLKLDKFGAIAPATLCGVPVWIVTAIGLGLLLLGGTRYRPVVDPGEYGETPGCLFGMFIGFFLVAMFLGIYFTEPIVCTGRDGDVCYEYSKQPVYEGTRYDGSSYHYTYRNNWVWISDPYISSYSGGGSSFSGSWMSDLDISDSEAAIFIIFVIILIIIVLSSAFVPNMWVLACALCIGATYLTILRLGNSEKAGKRKTDNGDPAPKRKKAKNEDPLLADPEPTTVMNDDPFSPIDPSTPRPDA